MKNLDSYKNAKRIVDQLVHEIGTAHFLYRHADDMDGSSENAFFEGVRYLAITYFVLCLCKLKEFYVSYKATLNKDKSIQVILEIVYDCFMLNDKNILEIRNSYIGHIHTKDHAPMDIVVFYNKLNSCLFFKNGVHKIMSSLHEKKTVNGNKSCLDLLSDLQRALDEKLGLLSH